MSPGRSLPPRGEAPSTVDPEADVDPDADSVHDEPTGPISLQDYELREIRRTMRALARIQREANEREDGRYALIEKIATTLEAFNERDAQRGNLLRSVLDRLGGLAERALEPATLTALQGVIRWVVGLIVLLAALSIGAQVAVTTSGITIGGPLAPLVDTGPSELSGPGTRPSP